MREPVRGSYRGYEIVSMPPPSSGGVHVIEILNILEGFPIGELGFGSAETMHLMAEAMKLRLRRPQRISRRQRFRRGAGRRA